MSTLKEISTATRIALFFWLACGFVYPLTFTGFAQVAFPHQANGSVIRNARGEVIGSELIGQKFTSPRYFQGRPSAIDYRAEASGASQLAPTNKALIERVKTAAAALKKQNGTAATIALVTTSGSGLDPHITPEGALAQLDRVAKARDLDPTVVRKLVERYTEVRFLGIFGEPRVNVLPLNLALDVLLSRVKLKGRSVRLEDRRNSHGKAGQVRVWADCERDIWAGQLCQIGRPIAYWVARGDLV